MRNAVKERAIDPLLFDWPAEAPSLKCSRCRVCGARAFPAGKSCMACGSEEVVGENLPRQGRLWTYTIQSFMPKPPYRSDETPETFRPFAIGYVELDNALRIETRIPLEEESPLELGMEMALRFYPHRTDEDGTVVVSYEFRPV